MRVRSEPNVGVTSPVLQIVERLVTRLGEVRNLVALDPDRIQTVYSGLIEVGHALIVRNCTGVVTGSALDDLESEAAVLVDFEQIHGDVRGLKTLNPAERLVPTFGRL